MKLEALETLLKNAEAAKKLADQIKELTEAREDRFNAEWKESNKSYSDRLKLSNFAYVLAVGIDTVIAEKTKELEALLASTVKQEAVPDVPLSDANPACEVGGVPT